jgi:hypothetical protein
MSASRKPARLTSAGLKRALHRSMADYRDLAAAIAGMWAKLNPRLPPAAALPNPKPINPVRELEVITQATLQTLRAYERARIVSELKLKKCRATIARLCRRQAEERPRNRRRALSPARAAARVQARAFE